MKPGQNILRSPDAFQKWSDQHRALVWDMIEKLGKGGVSCKEAKEVLREEKKALSAVSKQLFGFKPGRAPQIDSASNGSPVPKAPKAKRSATQRTTL
jgi:hypothetical protein